MISGIIEDGLHPHVFLEISGRRDAANLLMLVDTGFDLLTTKNQPSALACCKAAS